MKTQGTNQGPSGTPTRLGPKHLGIVSRNP